MSFLFNVVLLGLSVRLLCSFSSYFLSFSCSCCRCSCCWWCRVVRLNVRVIKIGKLPKLLQWVWTGSIVCFSALWKTIKCWCLIKFLSCCGSIVLCRRLDFIFITTSRRQSRLAERSDSRFMLLTHWLTTHNCHHHPNTTPSPDLASHINIYITALHCTALHC